MKYFYRFFFYKKKKSFRISKILALSLLIFTLVVNSISVGATVLKSNGGIFFRVDEITNNLGIPWGMVFISPSKILFTERKGRIGVLDLTNGEINILEGGPKVFAFGQGGLMDVAVPPDYVAGDWIYFSYSKGIVSCSNLKIRMKKCSKRDINPTKYTTTLARAKLDGYRLVEFSDLLITRPASNSTIHFGSRITFDGNGNLFFSVGDRGNRQNAQDLSKHSGSILRLRIDGSIPKDNPFVNQDETLPEIWSYGHRNPQGIFYDRELNRLWAVEHGPRGGDEINLILPGLNYGWPVISYGKEYWGPIQVGEGTEKEGMEQPIKFYVPSIAPGSLIKYSGKAFPAWKGNLIAGALKLTHLNLVKLDATGKAINEERILGSLGERIRAIVESPEGWLFLSTDSGKILSIRPDTGNQ